MKDHIIENSITEPNSGCWLWTGRTFPGKEYGILKVKGKKGQQFAHRVSYEAFKDKITNGLQVCHSCDTPSCVNPKHLWVGTMLENFEDCLKKGNIKLGEKKAKKYSYLWSDR